MSDHDLMVERLSRAGPLTQQTKTRDEEELEKWTEAKQALMIKQNKEYLEELFRENSTRPVAIGPVSIENAQNFREGFLREQLKPLLSSQLTNINAFAQLLDSAVENFQKAGVVEGVYISLGNVDTRILAQVGVPSMLQISPAIYIKPVNRFYAKTGTNVGNGEGDGYIQFQWKNLFGGGELLLFDAVTGTKTLALYLLNYTTPILNNLRLMFENSIYMNTKQQDWLKTLATVRGITLKVYSQYKKHNVDISWENCWRILSNSGNSKAMEVMLQLGNDLKLSVLMNYRYDTRNSSHMPTSGSLLRVGLEYSYLQPSTYLKLVVESLIGRQVLPDHAFIASAKTGGIWSLSLLKTTHVLDRFFIGGPNDVRLFALNGLGPRSFNSFVGGDVFFNTGLSLILRMPWTDRESGFKVHQFVNCGSLAAIDQLSLAKTAENLKKVSVGVGFGILYNHPMARLELNCVLPLAAHERDGARKGLQYGIGVSFL